MRPHSRKERAGVKRADTGMVFHQHPLGIVMKPFAVRNRAFQLMLKFRQLDRMLRQRK